jgi:hypothetical protein
MDDGQKPAAPGKTLNEQAIASSTVIAFTVGIVMIVLGTALALVAKPESALVWGGAALVALGS